MCELLLITLPVKEQITVTETWQMIFGNFAWMRSLTLKGSKVNADTFLLLKDVSKYLFKRINQIPNLFIYVLWPDDFYNFFLFTLLVLQNIHPHFPLPEQWYTTTLSRKTKYLQVKELFQKRKVFQKLATIRNGALKKKAWHPHLQQAF